MLLSIVLKLLFKLPSKCALAVHLLVECNFTPSLEIPASVILKKNSSMHVCGTSSAGRSTACCRCPAHTVAASIIAFLLSKRARPMVVTSSS